MTTEPFVPPPFAPGPPRGAGPRPATVVAVLVLVLTHATFVVGATAASAVSVAVLLLTHPTFGRTPSVLVPVALGIVLDLVLAAVDVLLVVRLWRARGRAQTLLTVWLGLCGLVALGSLVGSSTAAGGPNILFAALRVVELALCCAALVLVRRPATSAWVRSRSVGPAGPGL
jgi:hypothetical protein